MRRHGWQLPYHPLQVRFLACCSSGLPPLGIGSFFLPVAALFLICERGVGGGDSRVPGAGLRFLRLLRAVCGGR
jgi:hypothetical protein